MTSHKVSKPARSHKSKKERAKKSSVRVINDGFIERSKKPVVTGSGDIKSRMIRVDADFADHLRQTAMKEGVPITTVTRNLFLSGLLDG